MTTQEFRKLDDPQKKNIKKQYIAAGLQLPDNYRIGLDQDMEDEYNDIRRLQEAYEADLEAMSKGYMSDRSKTSIREDTKHSKLDPLRRAMALAPSLPTGTFVGKHRHKIATSSMPFNACIARPVSKAEYNDEKKKDRLLFEREREWTNLRKAEV